MRNFAWLIAAIMAVGGVQAQAAPSGFGFAATLRFDPAIVVGVNGETMGALMTELSGVDASGGSAAISGILTYDTETEPGARNMGVAGYPDAITGAELQLGAVRYTVDIPMIRANAATSKIGGIARADGFFCADFEHCAKLGVRNAPWGLQAAVLNDFAQFVLDETGEEVMSGDAFGFQMGRTGGFGEFSPAVQTVGFGVVAVDGFSLGLFSRNGALLDDLNLPTFAQLAGTSDIARTEVWLFLEGTALPGILRIEGTVDRFDVLE